MKCILQNPFSLLFIFYFCYIRCRSGCVVSHLLTSHMVPGSVTLHGTLGKCLLL
uniref:Uncharacterized protein n=1 Tax=Octopus bimaculoides TaxID=37653 RepID=A0A0L8GK81_OCTBM